MTLKLRFSLIGMGIIIFLIATPFLVLYARGFVIDWANRGLVKTGAIVIKTEPTKAVVFLNDEQQDSLTPTNIRFLLPNDYIIRVEKEGYQNWSKRLNVRSQLVTWANLDREFITLFLQTPKLEKTYPPDDAEALKEIQKILSEDTTADKVTFPDKNILTYTKNGNTVWYIHKNQLKSLNLTNQEVQIINDDVPDAKTGQIINANNQIYLVLDNALYVLNDTLEKIYDNVAYAKFDSNSELLLFSNNNEILTYNPAAKDVELVLRSTSQISNPILNAETGYTFFANEGKIKAIEMDGRDHRNIYTIIDNIGGFVISNDGVTLYTFSTQETKKYVIR